MKIKIGSRRNSGKFFKTLLAYQMYLVISILFVVPLGQSEVQESTASYSYVYEWSRRVSDYLSSSPIVRRFLGGGEPVTTPRLIQLQGYPCEAHQVTTEDGFIIVMHRIPYGLKGPHQKHSPLHSRPPIIVFHGLSQSSADWVINRPNEDALGFYLADAGYDVWLANQRGNAYSNRHVSLTTADSAFWENSIHEIGVYDLTAMINYTTAYTGQPRVHFIGYSSGCSPLLIALAKRPEYNEKVGLAILTAPGAFFNGFFFGLLRPTAVGASFYRVFDNLLGGFPFFSYALTNFLHRILPVLCHPKVDRLGFCLILIKVLLGDDHGFITQDKLSLITMVTPNAFSARILIHDWQMIGSGGFHEYDYGITKNKVIYGRAQPPEYNLTNVRVPVSIMVGAKDLLGSPLDAKSVARKLPNLVDFHYVQHLHFQHVDFCYAKGVGRLVYSRAVRMLDAYSYGNSYG
ncbi:unnamed protein product [Orchesella dallaii]|uniref:Partial AB-hydrolase lipase domain-containing protein n=1 Tax=Orchesella dallaii TaxID=48710 RepID=A0ABP1RD30_9HEXA